MNGELRLYYLDESGFSPSLATTSSWSLPGQRKQIPYENPRGRRVNVMAAFAPVGPAAELVWRTAARTLKAEDLVDFLHGLLGDGQPTVVVLDNGSIHVSHVVKEALVWLERRGLRLFRLPSYSPELNDIERVFRTIKHHEMPERTYFTTDELTHAVNAAFQRTADRIRPPCGQQLRHAA